MNNLETILNEIYELDESLRGHDKELKKIVLQMIKDKPDSQFDENFKKKLRMKLSAKIAELKEEKTNKIGIFNYIFNFGTIKYVGAFVTVLVIALIVPFLYKIYYPTTTMQLIQESSIPTKMQTSETKSDSVNKSQSDEKPKIEISPSSDASRLISEDKVSVSSKSVESQTAKVPVDPKYKGGGCEEGCGYIGYEKDEKYIYYDSNIIKGADFKTFEVLYYYHAKDKNNAYFGETIIKGVDLVSFEAIKGSVYSNNYSKDKNNVYFRDKIIQKANPKSFKVITDPEGINLDKITFSEGSFSKDDKYIFFYHLPMDLKTFKRLGYNYFFRDKNNVYYKPSGDMPTIIKEADLASFEPINYIYAKDKNNVYYAVKQSILTNIEGADPASFEVLSGNYYSKDKNNVYFDGKTIKGADPESFKNLKSYGYAQDKNNVYYEEKIIEAADTKSFKTLESYGYAQDKNNIYYQGKIKNDK